MTLEERVKSTRATMINNFSPQYRSAWLKWKNTRAYRNFDAMKAY